MSNFCYVFSGSVQGDVKSLHLATTYTYISIFPIHIYLHLVFSFFCLILFIFFYQRFNAVSEATESQDLVHAGQCLRGLPSAD